MNNDVNLGYNLTMANPAMPPRGYGRIAPPPDPPLRKCKILRNFLTLKIQFKKV